MSKIIEYIQLSDSDLNKLHSNLLIILQEFDRICKKHKLKYFLSDGTLLGAVRHRGFIPWDDDIDVQMLRKDYDKFCEICKNELGESFFLQTQETDPFYNWSYGKLRLCNTDFVRSGQEHLKQKTGIFIDIFPLDNTINNKSIQCFIGIICRMFRQILWAPVGMVSEKKLIKRVFYRSLYFIPRKLSICGFNFFSKIFNSKDTEYLVSNHLIYSRNKILVLKRSWFNETIELDFEKSKFSLPIGYEKVLTQTYGEYMNLPPKSERKGHCYASYIRFLDGYELKK